MKCVFSILIIATILISGKYSLRIKRQDDAIIFPNDDNSVPGQFLPPNRAPISPPNPPPTSPPGPGTTSTAPPPTKTTPSPEFLECMRNCPTTMEYNPVCGTNQVQYHNQQRLLCANRCGANVAVVRRGTCRGAPFK